MYHRRSSNFQLLNGINRRKLSPARAKDETIAPVVPQLTNNKNLHTDLLLSIGFLSTDSRPKLGELSAKCCRIVGELSVKYR